MCEERNFNDYVTERTPHFTAELICISCHHRYMATWPEDMWLKDLVRPHCNSTGTMIATGQLLPESYEE